MVNKEVAEAVEMTLSKIVGAGTSVLVEGELVATPEGTKQVSETPPCNKAEILCFAATCFCARV